MIPHFTVTIAVDNEHLDELRCVLPTWLRHKPELFSVPWVVVAHHEVEHAEMMAVLSDAAERINDSGNSLTTAWASFIPGANNRETMLSALVLQAPNYVRTPYYLKIDTDVVALPSPGGGWIKDEWFVPDTECERPAIIASPWGYTKPAEWLGTLDRWGDEVPYCGLHRMRKPDRIVVGNVARSQRIISWLMFGRADLTRMVATMCGQRLPVPSQDTTLWYVAERMNWPIRRAKMSAYGWRHIGGGGRRLRNAVIQSMAS